MTRELFGTIVIYGFIITVFPLVFYQMGYELVQWIKKEKGHQKGQRDLNREGKSG